MGGKCPHRHVKKRRYSHKSARRTKFEIKGDDMVYDNLKKPDEERKPLPVDEDLPGMGQYYCLHCDRYFANVTVRDEHFKTKRHKKRKLKGLAIRRNRRKKKGKERQRKTCGLGGSTSKLVVGRGLCFRHYLACDRLDDHMCHYPLIKVMLGPAPHTQLDADLAAGMGMPDNGPKLMSM
ncbi:hypothetical protein Lal_00038223 [Lupinus albus]|nr:hypothetical protein Lal_00038223 [Lupinus albus]